MQKNKLEQVILWIVKIGLWIIPVLPLYISSSMLFPFITGKNFTFRIIVEITFALWAGLAFARAAYRPKLTPLFKAVTILISILFLADLFGPNPYRSFFSNYERMEGFMMLGHFYLYFVMLTSVFKTRRDWLVFFHISLLTSLIVSFVGLLQKLGYQISIQGGFRVDSTIGNPTYLAAYLLFNIWLLFILAYEFWKSWWLRILYGLVLAFEFIILYFTATRGAVLALLAAAILLLAALVWLWPKVFKGRSASTAVTESRGMPRGRKVATVILAAAVIIPFAFWLMRSTAFIRSNPVLQRLTNYSLGERTIQSRFEIWKMSAKASLERPILGWGQENYYLVFQKYYDPGLWAQEPWFDRSHNIIFDWLMDAGFLGLFAYLGVLITAFAVIIRGLKNNSLKMWHGLILAALFLTYFLQDLFVFDNLNTYILFFAFLAYTGWLILPPESGATEKNSPAGSARRLVAVSSVMLIIVLVWGYYFNFKPIQESKYLIGALQANAAKAPMPVLLGTFEKALSYHTFGDTEVREQLASIARDMPTRDYYTKDERAQYIALAVEEMRKETSQPAKDIKHLLFLASILDRSTQFNPQYAAEAENILKEAIKISPTKQILYFELAQLYIAEGKYEPSLEALKFARDLDPTFPQANLNLLLAAALTNRQDLMQDARSHLDLKTLDEDSLNRMATIYRNIGDYNSARDVYKELTVSFSSNAQYHATYAALLGQTGDYSGAIKEAEAASVLDPVNFAKEAQQFIQIMRAKGGR